MTVITRPAPDIDTGSVSYYIEERLLRNLDKIRDKVTTKDTDFFWAIDGEEGSGKSVFTLQLAKTVDPSFCLDRITFTAKDFQNAILKASKGQAVVFDEAFRGLSSRSALGEVNKILVGLMMECRQKNLFVFVVMPSFFLLDKYVALWRSKGLFHVYTLKGKRGYWMYFNKKKKKILYLKGKALYTYSFPKTEFKGKFFNQYTVNENAYREKKAAAFNTFGKQIKLEEVMDQRNILLWVLNRKMGMSTYDISKLVAEYGWKIKHNTISEAVVKKDNDIAKS